MGVDKRRFHILYPQMSQGTLKALISNTEKVCDILSFILIDDCVHMPC